MFLGKNKAKVAPDYEEIIESFQEGMSHGNLRENHEHAAERSHICAH